MSVMTKPLSLASASLGLFWLLSACGEEPAVAGGNTPAGIGSEEDDAHGEPLSLGSVTVAGRTFAVTLLGEVKPGVECAFELDATAGLQAQDNIYIWLETRGGDQVSPAAKSSTTASPLHFHAMANKDGEPAFRVVVRVRAEGVDERGSLPLDGHGHEHVEGQHHGLPATFKGGDQSGHLELKLHDDKGDLELWLSKDAAGKQPFDLALDAVIEIEFVDKESRKVTLRVRNTDKNEDEDGNANIRNGKTNYFISPSTDAEWRKGKDFSSIVIVRFANCTSEEFVLKPHTH